MSRLLVKIKTNFLFKLFPTLLRKVPNLAQNLLVYWIAICTPWRKTGLSKILIKITIKSCLSIKSSHVEFSLVNLKFLYKIRTITIQVFLSHRHITKHNLTKERKTYIAICENGYYQKVTRTCGDKSVIKRHYHSFEDAKYFLLEGANIVLLRYFAIRRYRGNVKTETVMMSGSICESIYVSIYLITLALLLQPGDTFDYARMQKIRISTYFRSRLNCTVALQLLVRVDTI